jgi:peptidoglycan/xylan/chitin deacetylase (PgdA/CDA1 family)
MKDVFRVREAELAETYPDLTVCGDFTGDGLDELALFEDLRYSPNLNPAYERSVVRIMRSMGDQLLPSGSWFSMPDTAMDLAFVDFTVAGDYNSDGKADIAIFYNDPASETLNIFVLESSGSDFSEALSWYSCDRSDFNFSALNFACPGDFNGNGKADMAVFYNYFGTEPETRQSIFLFESTGDSFELLPVAFETTRAQYDFSDISFVLAGEYNEDASSDLAVCMTGPLGINTLIPVFQGSVAGQFTPSEYYQAAISTLDLNYAEHCVSLYYTDDAESDLAIFYNNPGNGNQEILLLECEGESFKEPEVVFTENPENLRFSDLGGLISGQLSYHPVVTATTWKEDNKGAISFTFDDGYKGAFTHGGAELDAAGFKGTFFIFTDTILIYDGEIAGTSLVREYKNRGHEIGSHSSNHSDLGWLSANGLHDSLSRVLSESLSLLNERFDQNTLSMSIPYGSFTPATLDSISSYFLWARSSRHGFNLATPYDNFALNSRPVLSTTTPAFVDDQAAIAESYGYYLPLMYHDMTDVPFDELVEIYTYGRDKFRETLHLTSQRSLWIDTHQNIMKYISMRNSLDIKNLDMSGAQMQPGSFSFIADDNLIDSIYNVPLTLVIRIPESWTEDSATVESGEQHHVKKILSDNLGSFIYFSCIPSAEHSIHVYEGRKQPSAINEARVRDSELILEAFPNPFRKGTRIRISGPHLTAGSLVLTDIQGRRIKEMPLPSHEREFILLEDLKPGIYILQLLDSGVPVAFLRLITQ